MKALLQLDDYWVDKLSIEATGGAVEAPIFSADGLPRVTFGVYASEASENYRVDMQVLVGKAAAARGFPYRMRLRLSGIFSFAPATPPNVRERMINVNGPAILYGVARGVVGEATATGPRGKYVLPSINFIEMLERRARQPAKHNHS